MMRKQVQRPTLDQTSFIFCYMHHTALYLICYGDTAIKYKSTNYFEISRKIILLQHVKPSQSLGVIINIIYNTGIISKK